MDSKHSPRAVPSGVLFVAADEPLLVYPSVATAESDLEAIDVENGVYPIAYGPQGEPYRIWTEGNRVIIDPTGEPNRPDELRTLLARYLQVVGQPFEAGASTSDLVHQVVLIESEDWDDRFLKPVPLSCCAAVILIPGTALYVLISRDLSAIPFVIVTSLVFCGVGTLARRHADQLDFRRS